MPILPRGRRQLSDVYVELDRRNLWYSRANRRWEVGRFMQELGRHRGIWEYPWVKEIIAEHEHEHDRTGDILRCAA